MKAKALTITSILAVLLAPWSSAQSAAWTPDRLPDGKPDFQGVWTNASLTRLERPAGVKDLVIRPEDADKPLGANDWNAHLANDSQPSDPDAGAPTDGNADAGYNAFWLDPGSKPGRVKGEYRSSWIVDPADGKIPYSQAGRAAFARFGAKLRSFDDPEARIAPERCLVGFGSTGGPPMLNVLYNNHYQFVQTADAVMILVEMNHDARIVRMGAGHQPAGMSRYLGDSVGRWEGDTLVVETRGFKEADSLRADYGMLLFVQPTTTVTERFTLTGENEMLYEFTVTDPAIYTQPWKGEVTFHKDGARIYEYACHEGNYALSGILAGARKQEREAALAAKPTR